MKLFRAFVAVSLVLAGVALALATRQPGPREAAAAQHAASRADADAGLEPRATPGPR